MIYTDLTRLAMKVAYSVHKEQTDKTGLPYIHHPLHLAEQMEEEITTCVALLHDTVEDGDITVADLQKMGFPPAVTDAVALLTHDPSVDYMEYVATIRQNPIAKAVKLADLRHNSDLSRMPVVDEWALRRTAKYKAAIALLEGEDITPGIDAPISYDTLRLFAYVNDHLITGEIRGIVLSFYGLGDMRMHSEDPAIAHRLAEKGILYVIPYTNPWCWMNAPAVRYTDEILAVLRAHHHLPEELPVVSTGGSMGGLSALVYCAYARITPIACIANCPVCDLPFHYTEREDLPRTLYSTFAPSAGSLADALAAHSPLHLANRLPKINYTLFHCTDDLAVNIDAHSRKLFAALSSTHTVTLTEIEGRGHCDLTPDAIEAFWQTAEREILE